MSRSWTENQQMAIEARDGTLLVSAAAGSGKTAVLVERVIQMITNEEKPTDADKLLVVTYTRAAAAEMRQRIAQSVENLLKENPHSALLRRQQSLLNRATISTIHSFCSEVVREYFYELDIAPDFRIAEDQELLLLKNQALEATLDEYYESASKDFFALVDAFSSSKDDNKLQKVILNLYDFLLSHPFLEKWLDEKLALYDSKIDVAATVWGKQIIQRAMSIVDYLMDITNASQMLLSGESEDFSKVADLINDDFSYLCLVKKKLMTLNWDEISSAIYTFNAGRFPTLRGFADHPVKIKTAANHNIVKTNVKILKSLFAQTSQMCKQDIDHMYPIVSELFSCVKTFSEKYNQLKRNKNVADFSDLEHWTLDLLVEQSENGYVYTKTATKISEKYDAVMVDEYQDANEVQDLIFNAVSGNKNNLFVVGDVKQSIYSFRQAMPEIFLARKESYDKYSNELKNYPSRVVLDKNFRSRTQVTDAVNFVFDCLMSKTVGDMDYTDEEKLVPGAVYPQSENCNTEVHLLELDEDSDMCVTEAQYIAMLIMQAKSEMLITENGVQRRPENRDFAILLRNANKYSQTYVNELKNFGIFAVSDTSDSFLNAREIQIILNYLHIIDNPIQDIPLLSVMMSPIYGFTADDLTAIRLNCRKGNLYTAVKQSSENGFQKASDFLNDLAQLRTLCVTVSVDVLIDSIYEQTGFLSIVSAINPMSNGVNNLRLLQEYARTFESNGYRGLNSFITYIDKLSQQGSDLSSATNDNGSDIDGVKVMSIHRSKGLEFPICILANTSRKFVSDASSDVLLHSKLGFACKRIDKSTMCRYTTMPREAIAIEKQRAEISEELRVFYVAMTRAKEKLIILCSKKKLKDYVAKISDSLTEINGISSFVAGNAKSISDWIVMCGLIHPSGSDLRGFAGRDLLDYYFTETSDWNFKINTLQDFNYSECEETYEMDELETEFYGSSTTVDDSDNLENATQKKHFLKTVESRLNFKYKNSPVMHLPVKVSASQLAHKSSPYDFSKILSKPAFIDSQKMTAVEKGTALHAFFQYCSFENARENIQNEIYRLINSGFITQSQGDSIDIVKAENFINSQIVTDAINSTQIFKEFRFTVKINASLVDDTLQPPFDSQKILLQGAVDLAYLDDNNNLVIVDYKTDKVNDSDVLREMYGKQLEIYKNAMEQCTDYKVSKCFIYSVHLGTQVLV